MDVYQRREVTYKYDERLQSAIVRIEQVKKETGAPHYRAVIEASPLHGTYGGDAPTVEMALDFLNLAMQAEGADDIVFSQPVAAGG